jgi:hypothetical protein
MAAFRAIGAGAALLLAASLPSGAQVVDLYGVSEATLQWGAAKGAVSGYYVIVARNGGSPAVYGVSTDTQETVKAPVGDTVTVQVAAFDASGVAGPVSAASVPIRFNAAPGGGPGTPDPPTPPADPDPTPEPDPDPDPTPEPPPGEPPMVAAAVRLDYTGDGYSDLLFRNQSTGALTLFAMQGNRVLRRAAVTHLPYPWIAEASGDFDGDGTSDLLWRNDKTGQLIVALLRDGAVVGSGGVSVPNFKLTRSWKVDGIGDFDGDGREDIALAHRTSGVVELLTMNGAALASHIVRRAATPDWHLLATPDADGDGISELVWQNQSTFEARIESLAAPGQMHAVLPAKTLWRIVGSGDLDGDGRQDLLLRHKETKRIQPLLLTGAQATLANVGAAAPGSSWSLRGLADFDGDGRADVIWNHQTEPVQLWLTGASGFTAARVTASSAGLLAVGEDED